MNSDTIPVSMIADQAQLRLQKLRQYEILNGHAEISFDNISLLAAEIFDVPNAGICFIEENELVFKSQLGIKMDAHLQNNPVFLAALNVSDPFIQQQDGHFFAIAPLKSIDGFTIGSLYVHKHLEMEATVKQLKMLYRLAAILMDKLETRMAIRKTLSAQDDRLHVLIHDLKNPMTTISLQSELVGRLPEIDERAKLISSKISQQAKRMVENLNEILSSARKEHGSFKPQKVKLNLKDLLTKMGNNLQPHADQKNITLKIDLNNELTLFGDPDKLNELFYQLMDNAIKFSYPDTAIEISEMHDDQQVTLSIKDNGVGLSPSDLDKLFIKFAHLSTSPTANENTNGFGFTLAKMMTDMHKGKLWAESRGTDQGTTIYVQLPFK